MTDKNTHSTEDEKLLDFQHERTYNQYLHEREVITSLKNTDAFRMTVLGVISSVWITTFLTLISSKDLSMSLIEYRVVVLLVFIITLASLYFPHIISHFKSVSISERFVVNDRRHLMDDFSQVCKISLQEKDIQLWRMRLNQTGKYISETAYRLRKTEFAYYLFVTCSILSIPLLAYSSFQPERPASTTYLISMSALYFIILICSFKASVDIIKRRMHKPRALTYTINQDKISKNNWNISIEGRVKPKCHKLSFWICTRDSLVTHVVIPVDKKGEFNKTITGIYAGNSTAGTQCFGILAIPENGRSPKVRIIEKRGRGKYIANITSLFGWIDEISAIPILPNYKTDSLPLKICSLLDDAGESEYVKCSFKL